jgi:DNA replication and repair protein RecF
MLLKSLRLAQFRNWSSLALDFEPGLTLIVGPNGTGKTNLLEAATLASCGASLRGAETDHMIQWGQRLGQLRAIFEGKAGVVDVQVKLRPGRAREVRLGEGPVVRLKDLVGQVPLVTFVPDDLYFIKGEPEARRRNLNMVLCQVDRAYTENVKSYQEALRQRNAILRSLGREGREEDPSLEVWDESLTRHGLAIMEARASLIAELGPEIQGFYEELSHGRGQVQIHYRPSVQCPEDGGEVIAFWRQRLKVLRRQELALGITSLGPHRDDLDVTLNCHPARASSSQGEQRTIALAFKFAQAAYLKRQTKEFPLFLLDDVLSELDDSRRERLIEFVGEGSQCLVTLTTLEAWVAKGPSPKVVHLSNRVPDLTAIPNVE